MKKKFILIFGIVGLVLGFINFFLPNIIGSWRWQKAVEASAGFPVQIGLTKVVIIPCIPTPAVVPTLPCIGGLPLCSLLVVDSITNIPVTPVTCALYSQVSGLPAGGTGNMAVFSNIAIAKAGLIPGGQLIAGGTTPTTMKVLASAGGCAGCVAKANFKDKIFDWVDKYIIAGLKSINN
ncbi:MAG: hypothetical protein Q7T79_03015 [bacterium]|nr:hypothetical protein [bacterium]